jgi:O-antigen/teichoic acid export membrane protein
MGSWSVLQLIPAVAVLVTAVLLLAVFDTGVTGAALSWDAGQVAGAFAAIFLLRSSAQTRRRKTPRAWSATWLPTSWLAVRVGSVNLLSLLNYRIELVILRGLSSLHAVGVYSVATALAETIWIASSVVSVMTTTAMVEQSRSDAAETTTRVCRRILVVAITLGVAVAAVAVPLIPAVFGQSFRDARLPLLCLLPGVIAFAPGSTLALFFSVQRGRTRYPLMASITSASVTAVLAFSLVREWGATGAAIACSAGYVSGMVLACVIFVRTEGRSMIEFLPRQQDAVAIVRFIARRRAGTASVGAASAYDGDQSAGEDQQVE